MTDVLDDWTAFAGEWLKPEVVKEYPFVLVPVGVGTTTQDGKVQLHIEVEYNGQAFKLRLNKTNQKILQDNGIASPKQVVGKKLKINKMKVNNPATKQQVDSFIIEAVA